MVVQWVALLRGARRRPPPQAPPATQRAQIALHERL